MSHKTNKNGPAKSFNQLVTNRARERKLSRDDGFTAYVMDRFLYRLGRSSQANEFYLKGGVLVSNLLNSPHRFTRDIDVLRRHGPSDTEDVRKRMHCIVDVPADDGIIFSHIRVSRAEHDKDGYDGVKVRINATVGNHSVNLRVDVGFGDAVVPGPTARELVPFLGGDAAARVKSYPPGAVVAEKVETIFSKFPAIQHRLKDLLDVILLARTLDFEGATLIASLQATAERRRTYAETGVLDDMRKELRGRKWERDWATMMKEKGAVAAPSLPEAVTDFDRFLRPLLVALHGETTVIRWERGGPWSTGNTQ